MYIYPYYVFIAIYFFLMKKQCFLNYHTCVEMRKDVSDGMYLLKKLFSLYMKEVCSVSHI